MRTIRSRLDDELMEIGDILGACNKRIVSRDLPPPAAVERVHGLFVGYGYHDEPCESSSTCANNVPIESSASRCTASITST
jgi:hypothetical protein